MANRTQYITLIKSFQGKSYYKPIQYPDISLSINDIYILTTVGDRLDSLANHFYNDVSLWWVIATANPDIIRKDSYNLKPNLDIRIPVNISQILNDFEKINK
jgi:hypothetical protein